MALLKASPVQFKLATLHIPEKVEATWFIYWYNINPATGKLERVKKTCNLNRLTDLKERRNHANYCIAEVNHNLKKGWNYFTAVEVVEKQQTKAVEVAEKNTLVSALTTALKTRMLGTKPRTAGSYKSFVKVFSDWATANGYATIPVADMNKEVFMEYLFDRSEQGWGNRNLNDHTSFFKTTFNVIKKNKLIADNPIEDIEPLPEHGSSLFQPLTLNEIKQIVPALIAHNLRFYLFTKFIPHEFIRPWHIARLKAGDIDYERSLIMLSPETTKNNKSIQKELLPGMKAILLEMGCDKIPGNHYLFGKKNFEPSDTLYPTLSIRAAELWKALVIDGMGIDKKMYALKHTSSQYLVQENNNFDLKFLQQHMEHSSYQQTEIYLQNKVVKKIDKTANILGY